MDVDITGAKILAEINVPFLSKYLGVWQLTETLVVSWIVMAIITITCIILTRNLKVENVSKRQAVAEWLVELVTNLVRDNTGGTKMDWLIPLVAALFSTSVRLRSISVSRIKKYPFASAYEYSSCFCRVSFLIHSRIFAFCPPAVIIGSTGIQSVK